MEIVPKPLSRVEGLVDILGAVITWDFQKKLKFFRTLLESEKRSDFRNLIFSDNLDDLDPDTYETIEKSICQVMGNILNDAFSFLGKLVREVEFNPFITTPHSGKVLWLLGNKYLSGALWINTCKERISRCPTSDDDNIYSSRQIIEMEIHIRPRFSVGDWKRFVNIGYLLELDGLPNEIGSIIVLMMVM